MQAVRFFLVCAVLFGLLCRGPDVRAAGPMESVRSVTDRVVELLEDDYYGKEENRDELADKVGGTVRKMFDWEAVARSSLSTHWRDLTRAQQEEFTGLFAEFMERSYSEKLDDYSGEEIVYLREEIEGDRARVIGRFITRKKQEIPVEYRMRKKDGEWLIYDVLIEGVSLVRNYRVQFNDIIVKSSYEELLKRIREKLEGGF
jgi:phospholipid transport system substrate-binding protein